VRVPATIGRRCTADMVGRRDERDDDTWSRRTQVKEERRAWCTVSMME